MTLSDIVALDNNLNSVVPTKRAPYPKHDTSLTKAQKRRITTISNLHKRIKDFHHSLQALTQARSTHYDSQQLTKKINDLKTKLYQSKKRLKMYENDATSLDKIKWTFGTLEMDGKNSHYHFLKMVLDRDWKYIKQRFYLRVDRHIEGGTPTGKQSETNRKRYGTEELELAMEDAYGKAYPKWRKTFHDRVKKIREALLEDRSIILGKEEGRWLVRHVKNLGERIERDRAINYQLPKEKAMHTYQENIFRKKGHKQFDTYDLAEITSHRSIERLMKAFPCQLREEERTTLSQLATNLKEKLKETFIKNYNPYKPKPIEKTI